MKPTDRTITATAAILVTLATLTILAGSWLAGCSLRPTPEADIPTEGTTNLSDLVLAGDLTIGDDLTVTDDMTVDAITASGDLVVTGNIAGAALTATGLATLNGGLAMDTNKFTVADTSGNTSIAGTVTVAYDVEHMRLPSIMSEDVITSTDGALWTVADGEIWYIHAIFCHVTTNFDCTGDDCTIEIGDGGDIDGLLDLDDAELQAADTEGTGAPAGWQGIMGSSTRGAYLAEGIGFIYAPSGAAETIDIKIEDTSATTDPTAGAATCYLVYTRLQ